jgi:hypothetical protein
MSDRAELATGGTFEPAKYLVNLNGRGEYLEVKWRLLWLRTEHPEAHIETELVRLQDNEAVFKARVSIPNGGSATGWGSESVGDFRDFVEKAETKAIGRALAALGYGTQFCQDHEFGQGAPAGQGGQMRIVDAPVDFTSNRERRQVAEAGGTATQAAPTGDPGSQRATERQVKFIHAIAREAGLDEQELAAWSQELYGKPVDRLDRRDASTLIEALQRRRNEVA